MNIYRFTDKEIIDISSKRNSPAFTRSGECYVVRVNRIHSGFSASGVIESRDLNVFATEAEAREWAARRILSGDSCSAYQDAFTVHFRTIDMKLADPQSKPETKEIEYQAFTDTRIRKFRIVKTGSHVEVAQQDMVPVWIEADAESDFPARFIEHDGEWHMSGDDWWERFCEEVDKDRYVDVVDPSCFVHSIDITPAGYSVDRGSSHEETFEHLADALKFAHSGAGVLY